MATDKYRAALEQISAVIKRLNHGAFEENEALSHIIDILEDVGIGTDADDS